MYKRQDHIGALPYVLKEINVPVYGTKLTLGLLASKLKENNVTNIKLNTIRPRDIIKLGCFKVEVFRVSHSIPDAVDVYKRQGLCSSCFSFHRVILHRLVAP